MHVREASFIASNEPIACNHASAQPPSLSAPPATVYGAGGNQPPQTPQSQKKQNGRKGPSAGLIAAWVCVAQLGIIIWLLGAQSLGLDKAVDSIKRATQALMASAMDAASSDAVSDEQGAKTASRGKKKSKSRKSKRSAGGASLGGAFNWPIVKNFVPPPPPVMPDSKLMVPPPPVAFSLDKAPGAVGAMTLPPPPPQATLPVREPKEIKPVSKQLKPKDTTDSHVVAVHAAQSAPIPGVSAENAAVSEAKAIDASEPAAVQAEEHASGAEAPAAPAPALPPLVAAPVVQAAPVVPVVSHPAQPAIRTVISGHRKRIIADR